MIDAGRAYRDRTVAVTGARGYIGAALSAALSAARARPILLSRDDVQSPDSWHDIVQRADIVFHLAGNTSVQTADRDPAGSLGSTLLPLYHLTAAARAAGRRVRVVYASTATVYGLTDRLPVDEDTPPAPMTAYDQHKWFAEETLALASREGVLDAVSLRLANVYGPSPSSSTAADRGVLNRAAAAALRGSELVVYGGGTYLRDYVYIDDAVRAFLAVGAHTAATGRRFNVGSGAGVTIHGAFELLVAGAERVSGQHAPLRDVPWPPGTHPIERRSFVADIRRLTQACGWSPAVSLGDGIDRLLASLNQPAPARA